MLNGKFLYCENLSKALMTGDVVATSVRLWSQLCDLEYWGCKQPFGGPQFLTISCGPHCYGNPGGLAHYDLFKDTIMAIQELPRVEKGEHVCPRLPDPQRLFYLG